MPERANKQMGRIYLKYCILEQLKNENVQTY